MNPVTPNSAPGQRARKRQSPRPIVNAVPATANQRNLISQSMRAISSASKGSRSLTESIRLAQVSAAQTGGQLDEFGQGHGLVEEQVNVKRRSWEMPNILGIGDAGDHDDRHLAQIGSSSISSLT